MGVVDAGSRQDSASLSQQAAQRELNAMAARLAELQAETTRLNALIAQQKRETAVFDEMALRRRAL